MTPDTLRTILSYDEGSGNFHWLTRRRGTRTDSRLAGYTAPDGRKYVTINGVRYLAHRLAWFYSHGRWPEVALDHIDGNPGNNRLNNLREATLSQNQQNQRSGARRGTSRYLGVSWCARKGKWAAQIKHRGEHHWLGYHASEEAAATAYDTAKTALHEFRP